MVSFLRKYRMIGNWYDERNFDQVQPAKFAGHVWLKSTSPCHYPIVWYFLKGIANLVGAE